MTGFGRGESSQGWVAEVRTVNHRFLDQRISLPAHCIALEERVKNTVAAAQERGRVEVFFSCATATKGNGPSLLTVDLALARQYHACLVQIKQELGLDSSVTLRDILDQRGILVMQDQHPDLDEEWPSVEEALQRALAKCTQMREQEGQMLKEELKGRLAAFSRLVQEVQEALPELLQQRQHELHLRLSKLLQDKELDPARLAQEAAILADKADVTEEIVRLNSHIKQFTLFLDSEESVGRRLDFLLQEFLREVNTLASKIANATIASLGVEMKNEIEKLREQVQNIE
jgi:uncharacterized protein (TIGR00255 family)